MTVRPFASSLFAFALLFGCANSTTPDDPPFNPAEGEWTVTSADTTIDGCGGLEQIEELLQGGLAEGQTFELMLGESDGTFEIPTVDQADPLMCSLLANRMDFICEPVSFSLDLGDLLGGLPEGNPLREILDSIPGGGSLTFSLDLDVDGTFDTERTGSATSVVDLDCDGLLCAGLEFAGFSFPCAVTTDSMLEGPPAE